jgi:glycosyltransferase involved in cell wall biosynthesis
MKIALVRPPLAGHMLRGTGNYTEQLITALASHKGKDIYSEMVDFGTDLEAFDIVHYPYFDPFFLTLPLSKKKSTIVTVHDLIPLLYPREFPKGLRGTIKWYIQRHSLSSASKIITDSRSSESDIKKYINISESKIHVVYLAASNQFKKITDEKKLLQIRKKLRLPESFILCVGDVNYNKNIPTLLHAFQRMKASFPKLKLVLVGMGFIQSSVQMEHLSVLIKQLAIESDVVKIGKLSVDELVGVYNLAEFYIQPSLAEGFGLPVLEAMSCGCPVAISDRTSLPEIAGNAALYFNPENPDEISAIASRILDDSDLKESLIQKGFKQSSTFTWEKTAEDTISVYQKAYEENIRSGK